MPARCTGLPVSLTRLTHDRGLRSRRQDGRRQQANIGNCSICKSLTVMNSYEDAALVF
jgi:hypothetical protein